MVSPSMTDKKNPTLDMALVNSNDHAEELVVRNNLGSSNDELILFRLDYKNRDKCRSVNKCPGFWNHNTEKLKN